MKLYDCFLFFNELDLLEIRLNELNGVVDYFVLVEAGRTFHNNPKPLYYSEARDDPRFVKFKDKIIHVVVEDDEFVDVDPSARPNRNEVHSWEVCARRGLAAAADDDWVFIGAVDEIPNVESFLKLKPDFDVVEHYRFEQVLFYYYLDTVFGETDRPPVRPGWTWYGTCFTTKGHLIGDPYRVLEVSRKPQYYAPVNVIPNGGWHFSYLGDAQNTSYKIQAMPDWTKVWSELSVDELQLSLDNLMDPLQRSNCVCAGHIRIDDLPRYVQSNINKFERYIHQL